MAYNDTTKAGNLATVGSKVSIPSGLNATVGIQVSGNGAGFTLTPQGSMDGGNTWITVEIYPAGSGAGQNAVSTITANGNFEFAFGGFDYFRVINTVAATSGTVNTNLTANQSFKASLSKVVTANGGGASGDGIGNKSDAPAASETVDASLVALLKLLLQRTPAQASGRVPVLTPRISGENEIRDLLRIGHGTDDYVDIPANTAAGAIAGRLKKPASNNGAVKDQIVAVIVTVTDEDNCQVLLTDGSGVSGAMGNRVLVANGTGKGTFVIPLYNITSRDGGWSIVTGTGVLVTAIGLFS